MQGDIFMKRVLLTVSACAVLLCGCVSSKEYAKLNDDYAELEQQNKHYQYEISQKDEQIAQLENKYESLKNGAGIQLSHIREAFFLEKYESVVYFTEQLYETHPDSKEYSEALPLYEVAKAKVDEKAKQKQQQKESQQKETAKKETTKKETQTSNSTTSTYEWKLNTNSTGKDWNSVNDTEKDVWCSNSITAWRLMGYDIPSGVTVSHMHKSLDNFYEDKNCINTDLVTASEAYAIASGVY